VHCLVYSAINEVNDDIDSLNGDASDS